MIDVEVPMDVLSDSIKLHGMQIKKVVCAEEMSELIKEICKDLRGEIRRNDLIEEVADVYICLNMLKLMYDIPDSTIQQWADYKIERQVKRDWEYAHNKNRGSK